MLVLARGQGVPYPGPGKGISCPGPGRVKKVKTLPSLVLRTLAVMMQNKVSYILSWMAVAAMHFNVFQNCSLFRIIRIYRHVGGPTIQVEMKLFHEQEYLSTQGVLYTCHIEHEIISKKQNYYFYLKNNSFVEYKYT